MSLALLFSIALSLHADPQRTFQLGDVGRQVTFSPDAQVVAVSSVDRTVRLWRVADGKLLRTFTHPSGVTSAVFTPDGQWLVTAGYDQLLRVWRVRDGALVRA